LDAAVFGLAFALACYRHEISHDRVNGTVEIIPEYLAGKMSCREDPVQRGQCSDRAQAILNPPADTWRLVDQIRHVVNQPVRDCPLASQLSR
jgi:hypothetical protein